MENLKIDNKALLANIEKSLNISNQLHNKIMKSKQRARYVQSARKAGWEQTNALAKQEIEQVNTIYNKEDPTTLLKSSETTEENDDVETFAQQEERLRNERNKPRNIFEALEVEYEE